MTCYRLRAEGLRHFDVEMFKVYLNYVGGKTGIQWSLSDDADAELLLYQASDPHQPPPQATYVAWILPPDAPDLGETLVLRRPFHLDAFSALLRCVEDRLAASDAAHPPTPPAAVPAPTPPSQGHAPTESAVCWRLTRWPDRQLLAGHPMFPRLAGFLAARPLDDTQLSRLSGLDPSLCQQFIQAMADAGLLTCSQGASSARSVPTPQRPAAAPGASTLPGAHPHPAPARTSSRGLISRLRSHLGMA